MHPADFPGFGELRVLGGQHAIWNGVPASPHDRDLELFLHHRNAVRNRMPPAGHLGLCDVSVSVGQYAVGNSVYLAGNNWRVYCRDSDKHSRHDTLILYYQITITILQSTNNAGQIYHQM